MNECQAVESFLDVGILVKEAPDQLGRIILEHEQDETLVDAEIAFGDPGLIALGLGGVAVGVVEAIVSDQARNFIHMIKSC